MNEPRLHRYSYNTNSPQLYPSPFSIRNPPSQEKQEEITDFSDQLRKSYETIETLKAQLQLEKQGRQFLEQQSRYLNRKMDSIKEASQQLQNELQKYKQKYRRLKQQRKRNIVEPFQEQKSRNKDTQMFRKQQQNIKQQLKVLQSKINTPLKETSSQLFKNNYEKVLYQNNVLKKQMIEIQKKLNKALLQIQDKEIRLFELLQQINIYHESNLKNQKGIGLLQHQIGILVQQNHGLKKLIVEKQKVHRRDMIEVKQTLRSSAMRSASLINTKQKHHLGYNEILDAQHSLIDHNFAGGENRNRYNSTKKIRYS